MGYGLLNDSFTFPHENACLIQRQPAYIRTLGRLGSLARRHGFKSLQIDADALLTRATEKTGLHDYGEAAFEEGLYRLTQELQSRAQLSFLGEVAAYFNLLDYLCVRLQLVQYRKERPSVAEQKVSRPIIIVGLPRSGTTILYEMLAQDPANRSPASWEVAIPVPPAKRETYLKDKRARRIDLQYSISEHLSPGFRAIHAIGGALPQECVYLFSSNFVSEQFGYMYNVPDYRQWCIEQDMTATYEWHYRFLQHMQVDYAGERWLLKTPSHLAYLQYLVARYPDAAIVWTHRNPVDAVASFSSLVCTLRRGFSDSVNPLEVGEFEIQQQARIVEQGMAQCLAMSKNQIMHVGYNDITNAPLDVIRNIYDYFGLALTPDAELAMHNYYEKRPKDLYGTHHYAASEFGIATSNVEEQFTGYLNAFGNYI